MSESIITNVIAKTILNLLIFGLINLIIFLLSRFGNLETEWSRMCSFEGFTKSQSEDYSESGCLKSNLHLMILIMATNLMSIVICSQLFAFVGIAIWPILCKYSLLHNLM